MILMNLIEFICLKIANSNLKKKKDFNIINTPSEMKMK